MRFVNVNATFRYIIFCIISINTIFLVYLAFIKHETFYHNINNEIEIKQT